MLNSTHHLCIFFILNLYQISFALCPSQFVSISTSSSCFLIVRQKYTWVNSRIVCRRYGSDLVHITDAAMMEQIHQETKKAGVAVVGYWVGLNDIRTEGVFHWTDGSLNTGEKTLDLFDGNQPNGGDGQNCACRESKYSALHDAPCSERYYSPVCEFVQGKFGRGLEMNAIRMRPVSRVLACSHVVGRSKTRSTLECATKCLADQACDMFTYKRDSMELGECLLLIFGGNCKSGKATSYNRSYERIGRH